MDFIRDPGVGHDWRDDVATIRILKPRHILFLCVANSGRSQIAEGIARSLAPAGVTVSSAGSAPGMVSPYSIRVLAEIGIDISGHRSKSVDEVNAATVDVVITLCAEESCPVFLGKAHRFHWALHDPAHAPPDESSQLAAYRATRDELLVRLRLLFGR